MDVTLKISDDLCKTARHKAVDEGVSLSAWVARLIERAVEPSATKPAPLTLLEAVEHPASADRDFEFERDQNPIREIDFR